MSTIERKRQLASGISVIAIAAAMTSLRLHRRSQNCEHSRAMSRQRSLAPQVVAVDTHTGAAIVGTHRRQG